MAAVVFTIPKVVSGVFLVALGLAAYWYFGLTRLRGWPLMAVFAVALLCFLYGLRQVWAWLQAGRRSLRPHTIVSGRMLGTPALVLAYVFLGGPMVFFFWSALGEDGVGVPGLVPGSVLAFILVALTYWRLRHWRYGDSVCRLRTVPARVGGRLEADVACALPRGTDDTVIVRLKNFVPSGRSAVLVWSMEERMNVPVRGRRTVISVRLWITPSPQQQFLAPDATWLARLSRPLWFLEIEKKVPGIDFLARFPVPVADVGAAPETAPEPAGQRIGNPARRGIAALVAAASVATLIAITYQAGQRGWLSTGVMQPRSEWLARAYYQREFDVWSGSHYPSSIHGRCAEGREEYRSDWEPVPYGAGFYAWYAMDRGWFEKRSREYAAQGFRLEASSQFQDCKGAPRFQGTWMKRMLAN